jgi:hypothetical protein
LEETQLMPLLWGKSEPFCVAGKHAKSLPCKYAPFRSFDPYRFLGSARGLPHTFSLGQIKPNGPSGAPARLNPQR